jgi:hypothetical protein
MTELDPHCKPTCWVSKRTNQCLLHKNDLQDKCPCFVCIIRANCTDKCWDRMFAYQLNKEFIYEHY